MSHTQFPARFGKYILLDRLNSGGMAEVYRAKVTGVEQFQRLVAIKCMLPNLMQDKQFSTMFVDEAKLAAQLSHANIVQIYELGKYDDALYIAMELVHGRDLRHVIRVANQKNVRLPLGFAAYVVSKAAEGLDAAHRRTAVDGTALNLVHRDVSPQNILVSYDGEVKVVDFGIAKAEERATETRAGVLKGKFAYMAPEQVSGASIDRRADIFALGSVLYEAVTGNKLFAGQSDLSILEKVRNAKVPDFHLAFPDAPEELAQVLQEALAKDREDRFPWASEMAEALSPLLIENRSIFGASKAKEFMHELYATEIEELAEQLRQFAEITDADCVENSKQTHRPKKTEVFESTFATDASDILAEARQAARREPSFSQPTGPLPSVSSGETQAFQPDGSGPRPQPLAPMSSRAGGSGSSNPYFAPPPVDPGRAMSALPSTLIAEPISESMPVPKQATVPRAVLGALFAACVILVGVLLFVLLRPQPGTETTFGLPGDVPGLVGTGGLPPAPTVPAPTPAVSAEPTAVVTGAQSNPPSTSSSPSEAIDEPPEEDEPARVKGRDRRTKDKDKAKERREKKGRFGFISVKANGVKTAKVFINGKDAGYSPLVFHKVPIGRHKIKVVEEVAGGGTGRSSSTTVVISAKHSRKTPLKVVVPL